MKPTTPNTVAYVAIETCGDTDPPAEATSSTR